MNQEIEGAQSVEELRQIPVARPDAGEAQPGDALAGEGSHDKFLGRIRASLGSRYLQLGVVFLVGLIVGWLVLGWWLWPIQWTNAMPWHLQPVYQERYVHLVAETFWYSKDVRAARQALEGWDDEELAQLLKRAQQEAVSDEEHEQVAALAEALQYPTYETSIWSSLSREKGIVGGAALSILLFAAAGVLAVYSLVQTETVDSAEEIEPVEELSDEAAVEEVQQAEQMEDESPEGMEEGDGAVIGAIDEDEEDLDEEEDFYDAEEDFYEEGEDLVDSLSAFMFDEEEEDVSHLKELCERLPEIDVSELLDEAQDVARQLRRGIELRARKPRF
jgi:hypothetical protein